MVGLLLWLVSTADAEYGRLMGGLRQTVKEGEGGETSVSVA